MQIDLHFLYELSFILVAEVLLGYFYLHILADHGLSAHQEVQIVAELSLQYDAFPFIKTHYFCRVEHAPQFRQDLLDYLRPDMLQHVSDDILLSLRLKILQIFLIILPPQLQEDAFLHGNGSLRPQTASHDLSEPKIPLGVQLAERQEPKHDIFLIEDGLKLMEVFGIDMVAVLQKLHPLLLPEEGVSFEVLSLLPGVLLAE